MNPTGVLPAACDVVVVGAGMAGASVAWELADRAEVVLVEAEGQPGTHSTGRSAAVLTETTGPPVVRALAAASRAFLTNPPAGFADVRLAGPRPVLWVAAATDADRLDALAAEWAARTPSVARLDTDQARALVPLLRPAAAAVAVLESDGLEIDVDALLQAYLRGVRRRGGAVVTGAPATAVTRTGQGWRVETPAGAVQAGIVVDAAGAWADGVAGLAGLAPAGLVALRRTAFVFPPPPGVDVGPWPLVMDAGDGYYLKPDAGLLLGSPADETPTHPCDARADELDVALAVERLEAAFDLEVRGVRRAWAGLRTFAIDRAPVAGPAADDATFVWLAGQGGYGIKTAPALARLTAALALGEVPPSDLAAHGVDPAAVTPARLTQPRPS